MNSLHPEASWQLFFSQQRTSETPGYLAADAAEGSFVWEQLSVMSHANHGLLEHLTRGESLNYLPGNSSGDSEQTNRVNEEGSCSFSCF